MKDFEKLQLECIDEVKAAGIVLGTIKEWTINTRAKARWGQCHKEKDGTFTIQIAERLLVDERISEKACKETIIHELIHTCHGCMNHQAKWKAYADTMNDKYGYNIKRTTSGNEKGVENRVPKRMTVKYVFICSGCGATIFRKRKSKFTRYYRNYTCTNCGVRGWRRKEIKTAS